MPMGLMKVVGASMAMEVGTEGLTLKGLFSDLSKDNLFAQRLLPSLLEL